MKYKGKICVSFCWFKTRLVRINFTIFLKFLFFLSNLNENLLFFIWNFNVSCSFSFLFFGVKRWGWGKKFTFLSFVFYIGSLRKNKIKTKPKFCIFSAQNILFYIQRKGVAIENQHCTLIYSDRYSPLRCQNVSAVAVSGLLHVSAVLGKLGITNRTVQWTFLISLFTLKDILCQLVPFNCWCRFSDSSTDWINQCPFLRTTKGKQNEAKRKSKYLDLARELKKKSLGIWRRWWYL